jgi:hypothetical protein
MMTNVSLAINIAVLLPVCGGLIARLPWTEEAYGPASAARGILLSIYMAIGLLSAGLFVWPEPGAVTALLAVQVVYKVTTPFTVGSLRNPVVVSNLLIAMVHGITLSGLVTAS